MLCPNQPGSPPAHRSNELPSTGPRYTALRPPRGPVDAVSRIVSPLTATARQYDACRPSSEMRQVAPLSRYAVVCLCSLVESCFMVLLVYGVVWGLFVALLMRFCVVECVLRFVL